MGTVTIFAVISWWLTPEEAWLSKRHIANFLESPSADESTPGGDGISPVLSDGLKI